MAVGDSCFTRDAVGLLIKPQHLDPLHPGISLRISGDGPALQISLDSSSPSVREAGGGEMEIQDGASHFQLARARAGSGTISWQHRTGDVQVRMTVFQWGAAVRESARLRIATVSLPPSPQPDSHAEELKKLNEELHDERVRSEKLQKMVKILENRLEIDTGGVSRNYLK